MTVIGCMGVAGAGFLPWSRSGRSRSGLELARTLHEVGLAGDGAAPLLLALFLFTPFLAATVWVAALASRHLLVATLGVITGAVALAAGIVLRTTSLPTAPGVDIAMAAGILAIAGAGFLVFRVRHDEGVR